MKFISTLLLLVTVTLGSSSLLGGPLLNSPDYSYSNTTSGVIADGSGGICGTILTRTINVPDTFYVSDIDVGLVIDHTYKGDLYITLTSPSGTTLPLITNVGGSTDDFNVLLNDGEATLLGTTNHDASSSYPQYSRKIVNLLSIFNTEAANGLWTLQLCDLGAGDIGTITHFQLDFWEGAGPAPSTPFTCTADAQAYMFQIPDPANSLVSDVTTLNLVTGDFSSSGMTLNAHINAEGYNPTDNYIWGYNITLNNGSVSRIDALGAVTNFVIPGLPAANFLVGDVDNNGLLYLTSYGLTQYYIVDVNPASANYLQLISTVNIPAAIMGDWAFNPVDDQLYTVSIFDNHSLLRINSTTGVQENLGLTGIPFDGVIGATYFDSDGFMYAYYNIDGSIYRFDISDPNNINPVGTLFSQGTFVEFNDGARCTSLPTLVDFGDAPDSYNTLLASDGPRHFFTSDSTLYLGNTLPDYETDAKITSNAQGDTTDDAFVSLPALDTTNTSYSLNVPCSGTGTVAGWIDFDKSGTFTSGERDSALCNAGAAALSWSGLSGLTAGQTYARFRIASTASEIANPIGSANDGEVEDYEIVIASPSVASCGPVMTSVMPSGDLTDVANANLSSVFSFDYAARGEVEDNVSPIQLASVPEVGTVWGKAYDADAKNLYTSAFLRRHADLSPDGLGAIYEINVNDVSSDATVGSPSLWMDLNSITHLGAGATLFPTETAANRGLTSPFVPSHDVWAFTRVGRQGLAGLELSDDYSTMYAMDMTNRQLLVIDTASKTVTARHAVNDPGCLGGAGDVRPFGVDYLNGEVYIGVTCSGETNQDVDEVDGYVMKLSGASFTIAVSNAKGYRWAYFWDDNPYGTSGISCGQTPNMKLYSPVITNMELDENGNMLIGAAGINGFRFGSENYVADTSCTVLTGEQENYGYVMRATPSGGVWSLDVSEVHDAGLPNHFYKEGQYAHWDVSSGSTRTYVGGMAVTNCSGQEVAAINMSDPIAASTGGTRYMRTSDGQQETAANSGDIDLATSTASTLEHYEGAGTTWEKASGLGDIEFMNAPALQIGNTIWFDSNNDGIQNDGAGSGIEGVTVELFDPATSTVLATTVTNSSGEYTFSASNGLQALTNYQLRIAKLVNKTPLSIWSLTTPQTGADTTLDSDAVDSGSYWQIDVTSPASGNQNLDYDFGLVNTVTTGCLDTASTGVSDETIVNNHANTYDFLFSGQQVVGYCAEKSEADPLLNDNYEVNASDRQGFTVATKDKLARSYSALTDPDIVFSIASTFSSGNQQKRLDDLMQYVTHYYTDHAENRAAVNATIDSNGNYTVAERDAMKTLVGKSLDRVDGLNGETQYPAQTIFWLWNNTDTSRQDMIVPAIYAQDSSCGAAGNISGTIYTDSNGDDSHTIATESGISSITVSLYDDNGTAVDTSDDTLVTTSSSAADGSYTFNSIDVSLTYRIEVDTADADLSIGSTVGTTNPLTAITVIANSTTANQDFGFDAAPGQPTFPCNGNIYQGWDNPSQLSNMVLNSSGLDFIPLGDQSHGYRYNAMGFREQDGYIYAIHYLEINLLRIGSDGSVVNLGPISGLPDTNYTQGDVNTTGELIVEDNSTFYTIDVTATPPAVISTVARTGNINPDFAVHPTDGYYYSVDSATGDIIRFDPATGVGQFVVATTLPFFNGFGAEYFDSSGAFYAYKNNSITDPSGNDRGGLYRIDITTGETTFMGLGFTTGANDGASCRGAAPLPLGTLSGTVYTDTNSSNTFDSGTEASLGLITVSVYFENGTPNDTSDDTLATATETAADGSYSFTALNAVVGVTYRVEVDTADTDLPVGSTIGTTNPLTNVTVIANSTTANQDFGFDTPSSCTYNNFTKLNQLEYGVTRPWPGNPAITYTITASNFTDGEYVGGVRSTPDGKFSTITSPTVMRKVDGTAATKLNIQFSQPIPANELAYISLDFDDDISNDNVGTLNVLSGTATPSDFTHDGPAQAMYETAGSYDASTGKVSMSGLSTNTRDGGYLLLGNSATTVQELEVTTGIYLENTDWIMASFYYIGTQDYGDAPDSYATLSASNGASHDLPRLCDTEFYLGSTRPDFEDDGQPNAVADGDGADEDGITIPVLSVGQASTITATVTGAGAYLQGWIDWNGDGDFNDAGEQIASDLQDSDTDGLISIPVNTPITATTSQTYARFRWSSTSGLTTNAVAGDGEIEDYTLTISPASCSYAGTNKLSGLESSGTHPWPGDPSINYTIDYSSGADDFANVWVVTSGNEFSSNGQLNVGHYKGSGSKPLTVSIDFSSPVPINELAISLQDYEYPFVGDDTGTVVVSGGTATTQDIQHYAENNPDFLNAGTYNPSTGKVIVTGLENNLDPVVWNNRDNPYDGNYVLVGNSEKTVTRVVFSTGAMRDGDWLTFALIYVGANDYGDAPDSYNTLIANSGAAHELPRLCDSAFYLGNTHPDYESDGQPNAAATGDGADEDGVSIPAMTQGITTTITATVLGTGAYLQGWIDFNGDGDFSDAGEQVATNIQDGDSNDTDGSINNSISFSVAVPATAIEGQTYSRFRWSSAQNVTSNDVAEDGEVEDYAVTITGSTGSISGAVFTDSNGDNSYNVGVELVISSITVTLYNDNNTAADTSDDTLISSTSSAVNGSYSFNSLDTNLSYRINVDTADTDLPANSSLGTNNPLSAVTVAAGSTTIDQDFGFDIGGNICPDCNIVPPACYASTHLLWENKPPKQFYHAGVEDKMVDGDSHVVFTAADLPTEMVNPPVGGVTIDLVSLGAWEPRTGAEVFQPGEQINVIFLDASDNIIWRSPFTADLDDSVAISPLSETISGSVTLTTGVAKVLISHKSHATYNADEGWIGSVYPNHVCLNVQAAVANTYDYGDAPSPYKTTFGKGGARHRIVNGGPILGSSIDAEPDGQPTSSTLGDDLTGIDDEDGVSFLSTVAVGEDALIQIATTQVNTNTTYASMWIDYNHDGDFTDAGEQVTTDQTITKASSQVTYSFTVPNTAIAGLTYARIRLSSSTGLSYDGTASDGEVEDYQIDIKQLGAIGDTVWNDLNADGVQDFGDDPLKGVMVKLFRSSDNTLLKTTITDSSGKYTFDNLLADTYQLQFVAPLGFDFTLQSQGGNKKDSDADATTGYTADIVLAAGEQLTDWDAGLIETDLNVISCTSLPYGDYGNETFTLPKFDSRLGALTGVKLSAYTSVKQIFAIENTAVTANNFELTSTQPTSFSLPDASTLDLNHSYTTGVFNLAQFDGVLDYQGTSSFRLDDWIYDTVTSDQSYTPVNDFIAGTVGETLSIPYTVGAGNTAMLGGGGNYSWAIRTMTAGAICVNYQYEKVITPPIQCESVDGFDDNPDRSLTLTNGNLGPITEQWQSAETTLMGGSREVTFGDGDANELGTTVHTTSGLLSVSTGASSEAPLKLCYNGNGIGLEKNLSQVEYLLLRATEDQHMRPFGRPVIPTTVSISDGSYTATLTKDFVDKAYQALGDKSGWFNFKFPFSEFSGLGFVDLEHVQSICIEVGEYPAHDYAIADIQLEQTSCSSIVDLSLKKRLANGQVHTVNAGDNVSFTLDITNEGTGDATQIALIDYIPRGLTLNDPNWTEKSGVATLNTPIASLLSGDTYSFDVNFTANSQLRSVSTTRIGGTYIPEEDGCRNAAEIKGFAEKADSDSTPDGIDGNDVSEDDYDFASVNVVGVCSTLYDYGDAPDIAAATSKGNYQTLDTDNGAKHQISANLYLGSCVDTDDGDVQNNAADADDSMADNNQTFGLCAIAGDDEDGIVVPALADNDIAPTLSATVFNNTGSDATLSCWADYNGNGAFDNVTERGQATVTSSPIPQVITLTLPDVPSTAGFDTEGSSYLRCRLASGSGAKSSTGSAANGEIEDYPLTITPHCLLNTSITNILCDSKGTAINSDDTWSFDTTVTAVAAEVNWNTNWNVSGDLTNNGLYSQSYTVDAGLISSKTMLDLLFTDSIDPSCKAIEQLITPSACSTACSLNIAKGTVSIDDKGTASSADDELNVEVIVSGINPANGTWDAFRKEGVGTYVKLGSGKGNKTVTIPVNINDILNNDPNGFTLRIQQTSSSDCFADVYINLVQTNTIDITKTVIGDAAPVNWDFTLASSNCALPAGLINPTSTSGGGGSASFVDLDIYANNGDSCTYSVSESTQTGYYMDAGKSDTLTGITLTQNGNKALSITNNQRAYLFANGNTLTEGNSGTTDMEFTILLSGSSTRSTPVTRAVSHCFIGQGNENISNPHCFEDVDVSFDFEIIPITASENIDYEAVASGNITIAAGTSSVSVVVPIIGDLEVEGDETFKIVISNSVNSLIAESTGVGTIIDDDVTTPLYEQCHVIADVHQRAPSKDRQDHFMTFNPTTGAIDDTATGLGRSDDFQYIESVVWDMGDPNIDNDERLLGANRDQLVQLLPTPSIIGNWGGGIVDVDGLAINWETTPPTYYASGTDNAGQINRHKKIFSFDPATGATSNISPEIILPADNRTIDDLAWDKFTHRLMGITNTGPSNTHLVEFDLSNFPASVVAHDCGEINFDGGVLSDVEGLSIVSNGQTIVSTGDDASEPKSINSLFSLVNIPNNCATTTSPNVTATLIGVANSLESPPSGESPSDFESLDCTASFFVNPLPIISIADNATLEGNVGTKTLSFGVTLDIPAPSGGVSIDYASGDGTATLADNDYGTISGTLTIPVGSTTGTITIAILGDTNVEEDENFVFNFTNPVNGVLVDTQAIGTIINDDGEVVSNCLQITSVKEDSLFPSNQAECVTISNKKVILYASVADNAITEGDSGTKNLDFTVALSLPAPAGGVSIDYASSDATATLANNDYQTVTGTLTILEGDSTGTISVAIVGDTDVEVDENFTLSLSNPVNATLLNTQAIGTILDDDNLIGSIQVTKTVDGAPATSNWEFTLASSNCSLLSGLVNPINISGAGGSAIFTPVTVKKGASDCLYSITESLQTGYIFDAANSDTLNSLSVVAGQTTVVNINNDENSCPDILGRVFPGPLNTTLGVVEMSTGNRFDGTTDSKIVTNSLSQANNNLCDGLPCVSSNTGADKLNFNVDLGTGADGNLALKSHQTYNIRANQDFTSVVGGSFNTLNLKGNIKVKVQGEFNFNSSLKLNIDGNVELHADSVVFNSGSNLSVTGSFKIFTNHYSMTAMNSLDGVASVEDFTVMSNNELNMTSGTSARGLFYAHGDINLTSNGVFVGAMTGNNIKMTSNNQFSYDPGLLTSSCEAPVTMISIADSTIIEGDSGTQSLELSIALDTAAPVGGISFDYATSDNTATTANSDYQATSGTLTILEGFGTGTISIPINGDTDIEADETFFVNLSNPVDAFLSTSKATATIINDDFGPGCNAILGDFGGVVFNDFNTNGTQDITDTGVAGITVTAYDSNNTVAESVLSNDTGIYVFKNLTNGQKYRLEFTGLPLSVESGAHGTDSGSTIQFITAGQNCDVSVGISSPVQYCQATPDIVTTRQINGDSQLGGTSASIESIVRMPLSSKNRASEVDNTYMANNADTGAVWGMAYQKSSQTVFASAFLKRHVGFGSLGTGGIYISDPATDTTSPWLDVRTIGINTGDDTRDGSTANSLPADADIPSYDENAFHEAGKLSIGDIEFNATGNSLWLVNLLDRRLYRINNVSPSQTPTAADVQGGYPINHSSISCKKGVLRPWALKIHNEQVYVGAVCSAENNASAKVENMTAHILSFDPTTELFTPVFEFPLNYERQHTLWDVDTGEYWNTWYEAEHASDPDITSLWGAPTPLLSDIEFDQDGSMILAFMDRFSLMRGQANYLPDNKAKKTNLVADDATAFGDILRACFVDDTYILEGSVGCESNPRPINEPANISSSNHGPGGGEYYVGDYGPDAAEGFAEITNGSLALFPGSNEVIASATDANSYYYSGLIWLDNTTGAKTGAYDIVGSYIDNDSDGHPDTPNPTFFHKGGGIGDIELLCDEPPTEVGNYVWSDSNSNGRQDAGEPSIAGLNVQLLCGLDTATTKTDSNGQYYFSNTSNAPFMENIESCSLRIDMSQDILIGASVSPINAEGNSSNDAKTDVRDSDAITNGNNAEINFTVGNAGQNNHSLDFGFTGVSIAKLTIVADYRMDECSWDGSSDEVIDTAPFTLHGTGYGNATTNNNAKVARAGFFDGSADFVAVSDNVALTNLEQITVSSWVKPTALNNWATVVMKGSSYSWNDGWGMSHYNGSNDINFYINNYNSNKASATLNLNEWAHVVGTYDGSTIKIYVNSVLIDSASYSGSINHSARELLIGKGVDGGDEWTGGLDETKIFSTAFTAAQIVELYNNESSGLNYDGTTRTTPTCETIPNTTISGNSILEGDSGTKNLSFVVTLDAIAPSGGTSIDYATMDVMAIAGSDYQSQSGTLTIPAGSKTGMINILINGDTVIENNESFRLNLSNPVNTLIANSQAIGIIVDDDAGEVVACLVVSNEKLLVNKYEENIATTHTGNADDLVFMDWNATSSTASNESSVNGDVEYGWLDVAYTPNGKLYSTWYGQEFYEVNPNDGSWVLLGNIAGTGNHYELVSDTKGFLYTVGTYGGRQALIKFLPMDPSTTTLVAYLDFAATGLNLEGDGDLAWSNGTLYWTATTSQGVDPTRLVVIDTATGTTTNQIVTRDSDGSSFINADAVFNDSQGKLYIAAQDEIYQLNKQTAGIATLSHTLGFTPGDAGGATTTHDFCASVADTFISVADNNVTEGDSGTQTLSFTVSLSQVAPTGGVSINFATVDVTATSSSDDYISSAGTLVIPAGSTTGTIFISIKSDTNGEPDETFTLNLSNPVNGTISDGQAIGTIISDDAVVKTTQAIARNSVSVTDSGLLSWRSVWVNQGISKSPYVEITAEIPVGTEFVALPIGEYISESGIYCEARGASAETESCFYEAPSFNFPNGRVVWRGTITAETEESTSTIRKMRTSPQNRAEEISEVETLAQNEVILRFTSRATDQRSVFVGQAYSDWYLKGRPGLNPDQRVYATDPRAEDPDSPASINLNGNIDQSLKDGASTMKPIPTVSEWSLLILSLLMSLMGGFYYRRRF